jgi:hypothetical protein
LAGNALLEQDEPILAGHAYNLTLTVEVPFTQNTTVFSVILHENMTKGGTQYWYLKTTDYEGYRPQLFTPGQRAISFVQKQGDFILSVIFTVPQNATMKEYDNVTLRYLKQGTDIVYSKIIDGAIVGSIKHDISDSVIEDYLFTANQKSDLIASGRIDASFKDIVDRVLNESESIYQLGLPDKATEILYTLDPSLFPPPPDTTLQTILITGIVLLAIIVGALLIMYFRLNTRAQLSDSSLDATRDELASLEVTAGRYDESLANQMRRLREKISEEE